MLHKKAIKAVKELGQYRKNQGLMKGQIDNMKTQIEQKRVDLDSLVKQKQTLINLYEGLKQKNIEAHKEHDEAMDFEKEEKRKMSSNFQKRITDISDKLQQQYKEKARTENTELRSELNKLLENYKQ